MGYIYCLTSRHLEARYGPDGIYRWVKIGKTAQSKKDLNNDYSRYLPDQKIIFFTQVSNYSNVEWRLQEEFRRDIGNTGNRNSDTYSEWFFCSMEDVNRKWVDIVYPYATSAVRCSHILDDNIYENGSIMCTTIIGPDDWEGGLPICEKHSGKNITL